MAYNFYALIRHEEAEMTNIGALRLILVRMHINTQSGHREFHPAQFWKVFTSFAVSALDSIN